MRLESFNNVLKTYYTDERITAAFKRLTNDDVYARESFQRLPRGATLQYMRRGLPAVALTARERRVAKRMAKNLWPKINPLLWILKPLDGEF